MSSDRARWEIDTGRGGGGGEGGGALHGGQE